MEIATARPVERFSHTQAFDNSYHFGTGTTLLQFTTGFGSERPSCMFSFDNVNAMSMPNSTSALKSSKLLKENAVSLSNFNCKRRLDFNRLTLTNSAHLQDENGNNNNNLNSINNNNNIDCVDFHRSYCAIENVSPQPNTDQRPQTQQVAPKRSHQNQIKPLTTAVQRRNERERNRVKLINMTFATLREHLPNGKKGSRSKKMSKVETLKAAIDYIRYLKQVVDEHDVVSAVLESSVLASSNALSSPGALASPCVMGSPSVAASPEVLRSPNMVTSPGVPSQRGASSTTPASSPHHSYCSDSSCEGISVDEDDLLDFSNWF